MGNLEVAQFIYLLITNARIRDAIDAITTKVVLILGRFTDERMPVLQAIRDELRTRDYLPVLFDFDKPASRDLTETVSTLAYQPYQLVNAIPWKRRTAAERSRLFQHTSDTVLPE